MQCQQPRPARQLGLKARLDSTLTRRPRLNGVYGVADNWQAVRSDDGLCLRALSSFAFGELNRIIAQRVRPRSTINACISICLSRKIKLSLRRAMLLSRLFVAPSAPRRAIAQVSLSSSRCLPLTETTSDRRFSTRERPSSTWCLHTNLEGFCSFLCTPLRGSEYASPRSLLVFHRPSSKSAPITYQTSNKFEISWREAEHIG